MTTHFFVAILGWRSGNTSAACPFFRPGYVAGRLDAVDDILHLIHVYVSKRGAWAGYILEELVKLNQGRVAEARAELDRVWQGLAASGARADRAALQQQLLELGHLAAIADAPGASHVSKVYIVARALIVPGEPAKWTTEHYKLLGCLVGFYDPGAEDVWGVEASCTLTRRTYVCWHRVVWIPRTPDHLERNNVLGDMPERLVGLDPSPPSCRALGRVSAP
eukprot:jgi/Mesvir1/8996/Mv21289-RA.1